MPRLLALLSPLTISMPLATAVAASPAQTIEITVNGVSPGKFVAPAQGQLPITIEQAMQAAGVSYTASWFPNVPGYGAVIIQGLPASTSGTLGSTYWRVCVDGFSAAAGMQTYVKAGSIVEWAYGTTGKCPKDSAR